MATYYVDQVNGNDSWTGTLAVPTPTITPTDGPFKEITKLRGKAMRDAGDNFAYLENGSHWTYDPMADALSTLGSVVIAGTSGTGQFSCTANTLLVGMIVTVTGTPSGGLGAITGFSGPTDYLISATNGTTTFTLTTTTGAQITTTTTSGQAVGGLTFHANVITDILLIFGGVITNRMDMRSLYPGKCGFSNYDKDAAAPNYDRGVKKSSMPTVSCYRDCVAGDWLYRSAAVDATFGPSFGTATMTGTTTLTLSAASIYFDVGMEVTGTGGTGTIPAGLKVIGKTSDTVYTMSASATFAKVVNGLHPGWYFNNGTAANMSVTNTAIKYGPGYTEWIHWVDSFLPNEQSTPSAVNGDNGAITLYGKGFVPTVTYNGLGTIFISSPIGINPVTYYNGLRILTGAVIYSYDRMQNGTIENINFENVGAAIRFGTSTASSFGHTDCTVKNCTFNSVGNFCQILCSSGTGDGISVRLLDNVGSDMGFFVSGYSGGAMGPTTTTNIRELIISRNVLRDCNKSQWNGPIYLSTKSVGWTQRVSDNYIYNCESGYDCGQREYDGGAIYVEYLAHNVTVTGNYVDGANIGFQDNSGGATRWMGNFAKNVRIGATFSAASGVGSIYSDYVFNNNTAILKDDYDPRMTTSNHRGGHWSYQPLGTAVVRDNIFIADPNFNYDVTYPCIFQLQPSSSARLYTNNYTPPVVGTVGFGLKSTASVYDAGVIQVDPLVDANGRLSLGSPCIGASTRVAGMIDATGIKFLNPPSIGAYEYRGMTTRAIRV
jgi:hypothetical protein